MRVAVRNKGWWKRRRAPTQDPSTDLACARPQEAQVAYEQAAQLGHPEAAECEALRGLCFNKLGAPLEAVQAYSARPRAC